MFEPIFKESLKKFTSDPAIIYRLWSEVETPYSGSMRYYHNLSHLDHLTGELLQVKHRIADWDLLVLTTAYHDIIYDTARSDNEEKSADFATSILSSLLTTAQMEICREAILATKGHRYNANTDINYFIDADLSILGASQGLYTTYTKQIRAEYASYPDILYHAGRRKVLYHFLHMSRIFKTNDFFNKYEAQARNNLEVELNLLGVS